MSKNGLFFYKFTNFVLAGYLSAPFSMPYDLNWEFAQFRRRVNAHVKNDAEILTKLPYDDAYTALYEFMYKFQDSDLINQGVIEYRDAMDWRYTERKEFYYLTNLLEQLKKLNPDNKLSDTIRSHITDLKQTLSIWDD
jgi:hypothetical protein